MPTHNDDETMTLPPGPWTYTEAPRKVFPVVFSVYDDRNLLVADVCQGPFAQNIARLIAQAPEVLAQRDAFVATVNAGSTRPRPDVLAERDALLSAIKAAGFEPRTTARGHTFLLNVQKEVEPDSDA